MSHYQTPRAIVVEWHQLRVNGCRPVPGERFLPGARVAWRATCLFLRTAAPAFEAVVDRAVSRVVGLGRFRDGLCREEPLIEATVALTDGARVFDGRLVRVPELSRPLLVIHGDIPDARAQLWVRDPETTCREFPALRQAAAR